MYGDSLLLTKRWYLDKVSNIYMAGTSNLPVQQLPAAPIYSHPSPRDPLNGLLSRNDYVDLYKASIEGKWEDAEAIIKNFEGVVRCSITENQETILHIAAIMGQSTGFVEKLMERMMLEGDLELRNGDGNTAFCLVAISGNVEIAKIMVEKNPRLLTMRGANGMMPLHLAVLYGNPDMVRYLYGKSQVMGSDGWTDNDRNRVVLNCIQVDFFDIALEILNENNDLPQGKYVWEVLQVLARKPYAFEDIEPHILKKTIDMILKTIIPPKIGHAIEESREATHLLRLLWARTVIKPQNEIDEILKGPMIDNNGIQTYPSRIIFIAAEMGNTKFLVELIRECPDLIWKKNDNFQTIFHVAVSHRRESVYSLLYEIGSMKDLITPLTDEDGNNMLHLVGMNAKKNPYADLLTIPFQMQRELLWFKEVMALIPPFYREAKNKAGRTPSELFTENHKNLVAESKKWMKGTINQCMVAAVLMATIGFLVVFSVPGGYDQDNGFPLFLHDGHLVVFIVFDAVSFILSSVSMLMFLSLVVSRYTQTDFLESLPQKLTVGLATLFLSIVTMMVAFGILYLNIKDLRMLRAKLRMQKFLGWLDLGGHEKSMKRIASGLDSMFGKILDEHRRKRASAGERESEKYFIDMMMSVVKHDGLAGYDADTIIKSTCCWVL
ncbi:accelerated cell death 6-like protein [Tanacetum coccineum]